MDEEKKMLGQLSQGNYCKDTGRHLPIKHINVELKLEQLLSLTFSQR